MTAITAAEYAERHVRPLVAADRSGLLAAILYAGTTGERPLWQLLESPGMAAFLDPATVPAQWLAWEALLTGGRLTVTMTDAQRRAEVTDPASREHGAPGRILAAVLPFLTGSRRATSLRRTDPAQPGVDCPADFTVVIHPADVPDGQEAALEAAGRAQAWDTLTVHFVYESGRTWTDLASEASTWTGAADLYETWSDAAAGT